MRHATSATRGAAASSPSPTPPEQATDTLRRQEQERVAERVAELERQVFGPVRTGSGDAASHAISVRDAQDRAARITKPAEARELLRRAEQSNDGVLARAIA